MSKICFYLAAGAWAVSLVIAMFMLGFLAFTGDVPPEWGGLIMVRVAVGAIFFAILFIGLGALLEAWDR